MRTTHRRLEMQRPTALATAGTAGRIERGKYTFEAIPAPSTMAVEPASSDWEKYVHTTIPEMTKTG